MRVTVSRMLRRDVRRGKHFITLAHSFRIIILSQSNAGTKNLKKLRANCRVVLTGTPVQNDLPELLAMLVFLMPKIFDESQNQLVNLFEAAKQKERNDEEDEGVQREEQRRVLERLVKVRQVLDPFVLRRVKDTVLKDLSPKQEHVVLLEPTKLQSKLYNATARLASKKLRKSGESSERALRKVRVHMFTELRKMSNHPLLLRRRYEDAEMLKRLAEELHYAGAFGGDCSTLRSNREKNIQATPTKMNQTGTARVRKEIEENCSDFYLHCMCQDYASTRPWLGSVTLPDEAILESAKFVWLKENLPKMLNQGDRVLIFSQWTTILDIMETFLGILGLGYVEFERATWLERIISVPHVLSHIFERAL